MRCALACPTASSSAPRAGTGPSLPLTGLGAALANVAHVRARRGVQEWTPRSEHRVPAVKRTCSSEQRSVLPTPARTPTALPPVPLSPLPAVSLSPVPYSVPETERAVPLPPAAPLINTSSAVEAAAGSKAEEGEEHVAMRAMAAQLSGSERAAARAHYTRAIEQAQHDVEVRPSSWHWAGGLRCCVSCDAVPRALTAVT